MRAATVAEDRYAARTAVLAESARPTDLFLVERDDRVHDRQFSVLWIEPSSSMPPVLPPGLAELPAPGRAAISSALAQALRSDPRAAERYRGAVLLGEEGTTTKGELLAFVRVSRDRSLRGDDRTVRVARFGGAGPSDRIRPLGLPPVAEPWGVFLGAIALVGIPALLLVSVSVGASSGAVRDRARLLWVLGAGQRRVVRIGALEAMFLLAPGAVIGAACGYVAIRLADGVRVGAPLASSPVDLLLAAAVTTAAGCLVAALRARWFLSEARRERYGTARSRLAGVGRVALGLTAAIALAWLLAAGLAERVGGPYALLVAALAVLVVAPLALPPATARIGRGLGNAEDPAVHLAGRWLTYRPDDAARPFRAVALLTALALAVAGYSAAALHDESPPARELSPTGALVRWVDPRSDDILRLRASLPGALVVPLERRSEATVLGVDCAALRALIEEVLCRENGTVLLPDRHLGVLSSTLGAYGDRVIAGGSPRRLEEVREALVVAATDAADLDGRVRAAAFRLLEAPTVQSDAPYRTRSDLARWLVAGLVVALVLGTLACLVSVVDRVTARAERLSLLWAVGTYPAQSRRIQRLQLVVPFATSVVFGTLGGLVISVAIVARADVGYPYEALGVVVLWTAAALLIGVAAIGARAQGDQVRRVRLDQS